MSPTVFADTFYYLALVNPADGAHARAVALSRHLNMQIVTTAWVVQELADALAPARSRGVFVRLFDAIRADSRTALLPADTKTWEAALRLYAERRDKDWSLTDCTSFVAMAERDISEALTGDHHFRQAGFAALLAAT